MFVFVRNYKYGSLKVLFHIMCTKAALVQREKPVFFVGAVQALQRSLSWEKI